MDFTTMDARDLPEFLYDFTNDYAEAHEKSITRKDPGYPAFRLFLRKYEVYFYRVDYVRLTQYLSDKGVGPIRFGKMMHELVFTQFPPGINKTERFTTRRMPSPSSLCRRFPTDFSSSWWRA